MSAQPQLTAREAGSWRLHESRAQCTPYRDLNGEVNLQQPERGVQCRVGASAVNLLGVELEIPLATGTLADGYERVGDLVATYLPTAARPHRVQIYWQQPGTTLPGVRGLFDLQVLTQTDLLDSDPRRSTISELPTGEVFQLGESREMLVDVKQPTSRLSDPTLPGVLVRPDAADWSYVEFVHPLDFHATDLRTSGDRLQIRQALFVYFLEKGVILRSRVRGAIVDRRHDLDTARALYQQLCGAAPPLAT